MYINSFPYSADVKPTVTKNRFELSSELEHALSMCILRSLWLKHATIKRELKLY